MKKEDIAGIVVYAFIIAFILLFGLVVLKEHAMVSGLNEFYFAFLAGAIVLGVVFNSVLFEVAHILGAKAGGYKVYSVNVLGFNFYKKNGKTAFRFKGFDGFTGETKIVPKENLKKSASPKAYLWFGSLLFAITFIILFTVFNLFKKAENLVLLNTGYFCLIVGVLGAAIYLYNILPFRLDSSTDGFKLTQTIGKNKVNEFNELLKMEYCAFTGETYVPSEDSVINETKEVTSIYAGDIKLNQVYILLNEGKFEEAETIVDDILSDTDKLTDKTFIRTKAQKIYIRLMVSSLEEAREYYEEFVPQSERREISNDVSMPCIRTYILMAGLLDKSRSETTLAAQKVIKAYKKTEKNQRKIETTLYNNAIRKVDEAHPSWELNSYLLTEVE